MKFGKKGLAVSLAVLMGLFSLTACGSKDEDSSEAEKKSNTPEEACIALYDAWEACDADAVMDGVPKAFLDQILEEYDVEEADLKDSVEEYLSSVFSGKDVKLTIENFEQGDSYGEDSLADANEEMEEYGITMEEACDVTYSLSYEYEGESSTSDSTDSGAYKVDGTWYSIEALSIIINALDS